MRWGYPVTLLLDSIFGLVVLFLLPFMAARRSPDEGRRRWRTRDRTEAGMTRAAGLCCAVALLAACATTPAPPVAPLPRSAELAPSGKLRAAINFGNPVLAQKDAATGEPRGVSVDLARELARRLGVPLEMVLYTAAGKVTDGARDDEWDIAFVAIDPARAVDMDYSAPYVIIEGAYLVPQDSPIRGNAEVDRDGVRVVAGARQRLRPLSARANSSTRRSCARRRRAAVVDTMLAQQLDVAAGVRQQLEADAQRVPDVRVLDGALHGHQPGDGHAQGPRPPARDISRPSSRR